VQLPERSARGTKLTDAGTRLYEHATSHENGFRLPRTIFLQNTIEDMARVIG
jgi:DNA-binding transcriptional LysR family regulator